uniref:Uncharacterized protein n=4 Tax=Oryza TaxID=4527 RepID=A0A0D9Y7B4_9ORYZ
MEPMSGTKHNLLSQDDRKDPRDVLYKQIHVLHVAVCQVIQWWRWKAHEHHDCHPGVPKDSSVQLQHRVEELFNLLFINHDLLATLHQGPAFAFRGFLQLRNLLGLGIFFSYAEDLNLAALEAFFVGKIREFWMARDIFWKFTPRPTKYERNRVPILRMNLICCKKTIREICHIVLKFLQGLFNFHAKNCTSH